MPLPPTKAEVYVPLDFWFSRDPSMPLPLIDAYTIRKDQGMIPPDISYEDFRASLLPTKQVITLQELKAELE